MWIVDVTLCLFMNLLFIDPEIKFLTLPGYSQLILMWYDFIHDVDVLLIWEIKLYDLTCFCVCYFSNYIFSVECLETLNFDSLWLVLLCVVCHLYWKSLVKAVWQGSIEAQKHLPVQLDSTFLCELVGLKMSWPMIPWYGVLSFVCLDVLRTDTWIKMSHLMI